MVSPVLHLPAICTITPDLGPSFLLPAAAPVDVLTGSRSEAAATRNASNALSAAEAEGNYSPYR